MSQVINVEARTVEDEEDRGENPRPTKLMRTELGSDTRHKRVAMESVVFPQSERMYPLYTMSRFPVSESAAPEILGISAPIGERECSRLFGEQDAMRGKAIKFRFESAGSTSSRKWINGRRRHGDRAGETKTSGEVASPPPSLHWFHVKSTSLVFGSGLPSTWDPSLPYAVRAR